MEFHEGLVDSHVEGPEAVVTEIEVVQAEVGFEIELGDIVMGKVDRFYVFMSLKAKVVEFVMCKFEGEKGFVVVKRKLVDEVMIEIDLVDVFEFGEGEGLKFIILKIDVGNVGGIHGQGDLLELVIDDADAFEPLVVVEIDFFEVVVGEVYFL